MGKRPISERERWFISKIGQRLFPNKTSCTCKTCKRIHRKGIIIKDRMHALYVSSAEAESNIEGGTPLKHFESVRKRNKYEKQLKTNKKNWELYTYSTHFNNFL